MLLRICIFQLQIGKKDVLSYLIKRLLSIIFVWAMNHDRRITFYTDCTAVIFLYHFHFRPYKYLSLHWNELYVVNGNAVRGSRLPRSEQEMYGNTAMLTLSAVLSFILNESKIVWSPVFLSFKYTYVTTNVTLNGSAFTSRGTPITVFNKCTIS